MLASEGVHEGALSLWTDYQDREGMLRSSTLEPRQHHAQHQPARLSLDRRPAVSDLNQFPRKHRLEKNLRLIPEVNIVGEHKVDVLRVLPGQHCIQAINLLREDGHPFVLNRRTIQGDKSKKKEV